MVDICLRGQSAVDGAESDYADDTENYNYGTLGKLEYPVEVDRWPTHIYICMCNWRSN